MIEAIAPEVAPATKLSTNVEVWLPLSLDFDLGLLRECGGSRMSVNLFRTAS